MAHFNQDFNEIKKKCLQNNEIWEDPMFPAVDESIFHSQKPPRPFEWKRPSVRTRGGTQYKSGYRDVPQTWVAKSGRQVHQWVPFFSKTWYFDGSIFPNFLKFAPKWRKFGTLIGQLFKIFRNLCQNGANFSENFWFLVHGWVTFPSKWVHGWVAFQKSQRHTPTQTKVEYPPRG